MKVELASLGRIAINVSTKTVPQAEKEGILIVSSSTVTLLEKNQSHTRLTKKLGLLTRASVLAASQKGNYIAGATDNGKIFRVDNLSHAQWFDSPGLEKSKVEQICVDGNGNVLVSGGGLCVYEFSVRTLSWEAFSCPFALPDSTPARVVGCSVSDSSAIHATFAWLLADHRLVVCNVGHQFLDKNQWRMRDASPSLLMCRSLQPAPDLSCFLLLFPSAVDLVHNSSSLAHFRRRFTSEAVVNAAWCRNSELILVLSPGGKLAILAKFMKSLFGFEQAGNEHGVPSNWMHVVNVEIGAFLELRPLLSLNADALLATASGLLSISVEPAGHTLYLSNQLDAQHLSISIVSELCLHLASVPVLQKHHVLLLAAVKRNLSRGLALCEESQLEEISRVLCVLLEWAVQLESVAVVKLMVFALRRFLAADKKKKYRTETLDRYRALLRVFDVGKTSFAPVRLGTDEAHQQRRRSTSITDRYYDGDTEGAMESLVQHAEVSSQSKELVKRLLDTKQELKAFEALIIILRPQGSQLFEFLPRAPKVRRLLRTFASRTQHLQVAFELLIVAGFWRDALNLSERLREHHVETLVAICLRETRRAAGALRDLILSSLSAAGGHLRDPALAASVENLLGLDPATSDELFVETLDLLLSEFLQESSRTSFDSAQATLVTVETGSDLFNQPSRLQLVCRAIQLLLLVSNERHPHLSPSRAESRDTALLTCFVNMLFCFELRRLLVEEPHDSGSIQLAQQLYLNSFIPSQWLPSLAQMVYTPSRSEEEAQRKALGDFYDAFCRDLRGARTKLSQPTGKAEINVARLSWLEEAFLSTKRTSRLANSLVLISQDSLKGRLDSLNAKRRPVRLKSGAKLDLCVLSALLDNVKIASSRAFFCAVLLSADPDQMKRVRFNPIVEVAIEPEDLAPEGDSDQSRPSAKEETSQESSPTARVEVSEVSTEKKLVRRLDEALESLERISKLQEKMATLNEDQDAGRSLDDQEKVALNDEWKTPNSRPSWSSREFLDERRFDQSMRRIRQLTSRSSRKRGKMESSPCRGRRRGPTPSGLRLRVRPTENGVHTTMVIDGRSEKSRGRRERKPRLSHSLRNGLVQRGQLPVLPSCKAGRLRGWSASGLFIECDGE